MATLSFLICVKLLKAQKNPSVFKRAQPILLTADDAWGGVKKKNPEGIEMAWIVLLGPL